MNIPELDDNKYKVNVKLDFSETLNPLGIPGTIKKAVSLREKMWQSYPDPNYRSLRRKLAVYENIPIDNIVCGNGGDDMIFRVIAAIRPKNALVFSPCSGEYGRALIQMGCNVTDIQISPKNNFTVTSEITEYIRNDTDMIFLCSPNDPTGDVITPYTLKTVAERCIKTDTFIVCDERFMEFVYQHEKYSMKQYLSEKVIVIKSFTEIFAMAGLPVGYALCGDKETAEKIRNAGQLYSISGAALAAAEASFELKKFLPWTRKYTSVMRDYLSSELTRLGIPVLPSKADFLLFRSELQIDKLLLRRGILIKNCSEGFGLGSGYYRIGIRSREENEILISEIERIMRTYNVSL